MARTPNSYRIEEIEGVECVVFDTQGKHIREVIVDKDLWFSNLINHRWTVNHKHKESRFEVKCSVSGVTTYLHRMVAELKLGELYVYNRSIDHKNNNTFDNRISNLTPVSQRMNSNNNKSKSNNIYSQNDNKFMVRANVDGTMHYKQFDTVEEAESHVESVLIPLKVIEMEKLKKKDRDIEFERGLLNKLENNELDEVLSILKKYNLEIVAKLAVNA